VPAGPGLAEFCRGRLAAYKIPVRWLLTDSFPLTSTGKIRKAELSAWLAGDRSCGRGDSNPHGVSTNRT
jgi:acyl-CoA synthetase (AMP-forming)/AMP-acid ligase II